MVLGIFFLTFGNANKWFVESELIWRTYSVTEALPKIQKVEIIDKK